MDKIGSFIEQLQARALTLAASSGRGRHNKRSGPKYQCSNCNDRGVFLGEDGLAHVCQCQRQRHLERLFRSSRATPTFQAKTFSNFHTQGRPKGVLDMLACAKDYVKNFEELRSTENNWLVLLGESGSGKTHLSMAVANDLLSRGVPVLYFQHTEGMGELKDLLRQGQADISSKLQEMKKVDVLIWDDLFKGRVQPTDFDLEITFEVLNYRYLNLLPTVCSSERLSFNLLAIDKAIGSRILERGRGHLVEIDKQEANYRLFGEAK